MTLFWIMTGLMAALAALLVLSGARGAAQRAVAPAEAGAAELAELDRLRERGLLDEAAWAAARAEAGRRLLSAPDQVEARPERAGDRRWVLGGLGLIAILALGVYAMAGSPGLPDAPYQQRVDAWSGQLDTLEPAQLAAVAARVVEDRPDDREALTMLGAARFEAGDPIGAASAFRRALALDPDDARSWARLGEALVRSQEGEIGIDAEAAFREALKRDPDQLGARYFLGQAALTRGDTAAARAVWTPLIAALDPADPRRADLERQLAAAP